MKFLILFSTLFFLSCDLGDLLGDSSGGSSGPEYTVVDGLKTALENGIVNGVDGVKLSGGYIQDEMIKILLPEDVANAFTKLEEVETSINSLAGDDATEFILKALSSSVDNVSGSLTSIQAYKTQLIDKFNAAADTAAPKSIDIFKTAILDMSFSDATGILNSEDSTAATQYLQSKTLNSLSSLYSPMVHNALETVEAASLWKTFSTEYNSLQSEYNKLTADYNSYIADYNALPSTVLTGALDTYTPVALDTLRTDLDGYVTDMALSGLFTVVGREEAKIRVDPFSYVTEIGKDILEAIFGDLDS